MEKKRILFLISYFSFGVLSVFVLYKISPKINDRKNGFIRLFPPHKLDYLHDIKLSSNAFYISGVCSNRIYLGNTADPTHYLTLDTALNLYSSKALYLPTATKTVWSLLNLLIDSPKIELFEGNTPTIWQGTLNDSVLFSCTIDSTRFWNAIPLSERTWILRSYDQTLDQTILIKKYLGSATTGSRKFILEKQQDGIFSTDGILEYDRDSGHLIYIYYYRNQFTCLDTSLQVLYSGRTIDTISHAVIHLMHDGSGKMTSITGNALLVNKLSCVSGSILFVHSGLLANNEDRNLFEHASVIDLYVEQNGKYLYSFYISHFQDETMKTFVVHENRLIALYDHYLVIYRLNI